MKDDAETEWEDRAEPIKRADEWEVSISTPLPWALSLVASLFLLSNFPPFLSPCIDFMSARIKQILILNPN